MALTNLRSWLIGICGLAILAVPLYASAGNEIYIPAGDLAGALETLTRQSGAEIVYQAEHVKGLQTLGVNGDISTEQAVRTLLEGTHLVVHTDESGAILIATADAQESGAPPRNPTRAA